MYPRVSSITRTNTPHKSLRVPAEATGDSKYTTAAAASATWIKNLNMANNLVLDSIDGSNCARSPATWMFTYNSGKFIEGLMVLGVVSHDSQWTNLFVPAL